MARFHQEKEPGNGDPLCGAKSGIVFSSGAFAMASTSHQCLSCLKIRNGALESEPKKRGRPHGTTKPNNRIQIGVRLPSWQVEWLRKQESATREIEVALEKHVKNS